MLVDLVFPPITDPRSPHLALPSLAARLRQQGVVVRVVDLDVAGLELLLDPDRLDAAERTCRRRAAEGAARAAAALAAASLVRDSGVDPLQVLRSEDFYDPHLRQLAREAVVRLLELHGAASGRVHLSTAPIRYEVDGVRPELLADLLAVTDDPDADVYAPLWSTYLDELRGGPPRVVGVSVLNGQQVLPGLRLCRLLRREGHRVVLGGTYFAKFPQQLAERPAFFEAFADAVVPYEGETALLGLVECWDRGLPAGGVPNTLVLQDGEVVAGPVRAESVPDLPTPDFSDLDLTRYLTPEPVLPVLTGKGCYFNRCRFCDIPAINAVSEHSYRRRPVGRVLEDLRALRDRYGCRHVEVTDEALAPAFAARLATALLASDLTDVRLVGYARLERGFDRDLFDLLHRAGFRKLFFGLESGSQRVVDAMDKQVDVREAARVVRDCAGAGIAVHLFCMVGSPEEDAADVRATVDFLLAQADVLRAPQHSFDLHEFSLDLRTPYFEDAESYGLTVDREAVLAQDFPLSADAWEKVRGLSRADSRRALRSAHRELRAAFAGARLFPAQLWAAFEEYSLLYADHFDGRAFGATYRLPLDDDEPVSLTWSPALDVALLPGAATVTGIGGRTTVPLRLLRALGRPPTSEPTGRLLQRLAEEVLEPGIGDGAELVRTAVDRLLATSALWARTSVLEPVPA